MSGIRHFYPAVVALGLLAWIAGGLLFGKTGLMVGPVTGFLGVMLLNDGHRQRVLEQRQGRRGEERRKGPVPRR